MDKLQECSRLHGQIKLLGAYKDKIQHFLKVRSQRAFCKPPKKRHEINEGGCRHVLLNNG